MRSRADRRATLWLLAVVITGLALRVWGISWGIPTPGHPYWPHHCDENYVMGALGQINPLQGDFIPEAAHIEGTTTFYLWYGVIAIARLARVITHWPHEVNSSMPDYATIMTLGRLTIAFFGTLSIVLVYLIVDKISRNSLAAILAAGVYAILPFEVMHSHFMRPHVFGNFLLLLISYGSLKLGEASSVRSIFALGLLCGLTTAARYNLALVIMIPALTLCGTYLKRRREEGGSGIQLAGALWNSSFLYLAAGAILGFVIGDPGFFLPSAAIRDAFAAQALGINRAQVGWPGILDLSIPFRYLAEVLPLGFGPLWLVLYLASIAILFLRQYYVATLPLLAFGLLYFFLLTKTYPFLAERTVLPVSPVMVIFLGVTIAGLCSAAGATPARKWVQRLAVAVILIWGVPSLLFSVLVDKAMADKSRDPYLNVYQGLDQETAAGPVTVGLVSVGWDWYMVGNFSTHLNALPGRQITVLDSNHDYLAENSSADFLILYEAGPDEVQPIARKRSEFLASGKYRLVGDYENSIGLGSWRFDYLRTPADFRYPFARISLLARR